MAGTPRPGAGNAGGDAAIPEPLSRAAAPTSRRRLVIAAVAVVAVAIVALLVLEVSGLWQTAKPAPSYPAVTSSFGSWRGVAQQTANGSGPGSWILIRADAAIFSTPWGIDPASLLLYYHSPGCSLTAGANLPTNVSIPGLANISQGLSYDWMYWFSNANGSAGLAVLVIGGTAMVAGTQCTTSLGQSGAVPPGVIDSPSAARAIASAGESAYLTNHTASNGVLDLTGNTSWPGKAPGPVWTFEVVDCSPINGSGTVTSGPGYSGTVDGVSGSGLTSSAGSKGCFIPL
jgi:hypothetical protein